MAKFLNTSAINYFLEELIKVEPRDGVDCISEKGSARGAEYRNNSNIDIL